MKQTLVISLLLAASLMWSCTGREKSDESAGDTRRQTNEAAAPRQQEAAAAVVEGLATVIDFSATWCPPCRAIAPYVHELDKEFAGKVNFQYVDVDADPEMSQKYNITSIPTFILLDPDGNIVETVNGADREGLRQLVDKGAGMASK